MPRKQPKNRDFISMPHQEEHDKLMSEMHDTLYTLSDKVRKPFVRAGEKLLPARFRPKETSEGREAKAHIKKLHKAFKEASKD